MNWGRKLPNGSWDGIIGMIERKEADIGIGGITISNERMSVVDFSFPYIATPVQYAMRYPQTLPPVMIIFKPFHWQVWIILLITILTIITILKAKSYALDDKLTYKLKERKFLSAWNVISALMQQCNPLLFLNVGKIKS